MECQLKLTFVGTPIDKLLKADSQTAREGACSEMGRNTLTSSMTTLRKYLTLLTKDISGLKNSRSRLKASCRRLKGAQLIRTESSMMAEKKTILTKLRLLISIKDFTSMLRETIGRLQKTLC